MVSWIPDGVKSVPLLFKSVQTEKIYKKRDDCGFIYRKIGRVHSSDDGLFKILNPPPCIRRAICF